MTRLDYYDIRPAGMDAYMSDYGRHFSKAMYTWAASMMRDRNGNRMKTVEMEEARRLLDVYKVNVKNDKGYDVPYVLMMARADYYESSITDEPHLVKFIKDYLDDPDGSDTRAFDEFLVKTVALGIPIIWEDMI